MIWLIPLVIQAGAMFFDELYFHRRRGLPFWERWGHPLDTLSFVVCVMIALWGDAQSERVFIVAGVFSCLLVTKDEFIHRRLCVEKECWLHSVLFILHPISLFCLWQLRLQGEVMVLQAQLALSSLFFIYQVTYWNLPWRLLSK